jgi:hypothetical protein
MNKHFDVCAVLQAFELDNRLHCVYCIVITAHWPAIPHADF